MYNLTLCKICNQKFLNFTSCIDNICFDCKFKNKNREAKV